MISQFKPSHPRITLSLRIWLLAVLLIGQMLHPLTTRSVSAAPSSALDLLTIFVLIILVDEAAERVQDTLEVAGNEIDETVSNALKI